MEQNVDLFKLDFGVFDHQGAITDIAVLEGCGTSIFTGSLDNTINQNVTTPCFQKILAENSEDRKFYRNIYSVMSYGSWVFFGTTQFIKAWRNFSKVFVTIPTDSTAFSLACYFSMLFGGMEDGNIVVWRLLKSKKYKKLLTVQAHTSTVTSLVSSKCFLISASLDKSIKVWHAYDDTNIHCVWTIAPHKDGITNLVLDYFNDNEMLISSSKDGTIKVFQVENNGILVDNRTIGAGGSGVTSFCVPHHSSGEKVVVYYSNDGILSAHGLYNGGLLWVAMVGDPIEVIVPYKDGFFTGDQIGALKYWSPGVAASASSSSTAANLLI